MTNIIKHVFTPFWRKQKDHGAVTFNHGTHEIFIDTRCRELDTVALEVFSHGTPTCIGNIDLVGTHLLPEGFFLYAVIRSQSATITWYARCK